MGLFVFSKHAEADLIDIYRYTYLNFGEQQAEVHTESLNQACQLLADFPLMNRERDEFIPPVRIHTHQKHLIVYQTESDYIVIVRLLHERMDVTRHL